MKEDEKRRKRAEELNNSRPLDVHKWSDYPEVNNAVNAIYQEFKDIPDFNGKERVQKRHIKTIVIDLYDAYLNAPSMYIAYHRGNGAYSVGKRYNKLHITKLTPLVVDSLVELELVENVNGHYDKKGKRTSHMARLRATPKLVELITKAHGVVPVMIQKAPDTECIILRKEKKTISGGKVKRKKVDVDYTDTPETERMRDELTAYNNLLMQKHIDIPGVPAGGIPTRSKGNNVVYNSRNKFVRRIFNGNWTSGGRFYGGDWQRIPGDWRAKIRINEMPTIELDYSGLHIVLCYAEEGIDYWENVGGDPYVLMGYEESERMRSFLKEILLASINAKNKKTAIAAIQRKVNFDENGLRWVQEEGIDLGVVVDAFVDKHKPIENSFFSGKGLWLQKIDSMMAEHVINKFVELETGVLVVHDSFIVPYYAKDELERIMKEGFQDTLVALGFDSSRVNPKMKVGTVGSQSWDIVSTDINAYRKAQEKIDPANDLDYVNGLKEHREFEWEDECYGGDRN